MSGAALTPHEVEAARSARASVGHAIRNARWRREHDEDRFGIPVGDATQSLRATSRRGMRKILGALVAAGLVAIVVLLYRPEGSRGSFAPAPAATVAPTAVAAAGRGRTSATHAPVAFASPTPFVLPTAAPLPGASGLPGAGAGTGTGIFGPPPLKPTDDRFLFTVRDDQTYQVLSSVCVTYGQAECRSDRSTNPQGIWWLDFPRGGTVAPEWLFSFQKAGYQARTVKVQYASGGVTEIEVLLHRGS